MQPNGWLTYTLAILVIAGTAAGYFLGWTDGVSALQLIYTALAVFGIRKSVANQNLTGGSHW